MDAQLLSLNRLAERTGLSAAWLRREAYAGRLPCIRAGRSWVFDPELVRAALAARAESEREARAVSRAK
jgi:hypothetical protein